MVCAVVASATSAARAWACYHTFTLLVVTSVESWAGRPQPAGPQDSAAAARTASVRGQR